MKSVRLHAVGDLQIHEEPVPVPVQDQKLVCVKAVGVCGSDLHWFSEAGIGDAQLKRPLVPGHEFAGEIGDGQHVAVGPAIPCGADVVFEAAGEQTAVDAAFTAVLPGGKVILVGIPDNDQTSFNALLTRRKGLTIKMVRRMKHTYPRHRPGVQRSCECAFPRDTSLPT